MYLWSVFLWVSLCLWFFVVSCWFVWVILFELGFFFFHLVWFISGCCVVWFLISYSFVYCVCFFGVCVVFLVVFVCVCFCVVSVIGFGRVVLGLALRV